MFSQPSQVFYLPVYTQEGLVYQPFVGQYRYSNQFYGFEYIEDASKSTENLIKLEEEPAKWSPNVSLADNSQTEKMEP